MDGGAAVVPGFSAKKTIPAPTAPAATMPAPKRA
jgi:hypothetical protein